MLGVWRKFKAFFGHHLILELGIIGSFIALAINPGSLGDIMRICGAIFLFNVLIGNYRIGDVTEGHLVVLGIFLIMLLINAFMPHEMIHRRSFRYFLALPGMILAIHCRSKTTNPDSRTLLAYSSIAVLAVIFQLITYYTVERVVSPDGLGLESYGVYSNRHHFGSVASLILPVIVYFTTQSKGWVRILCGAAIIVAFFLLWESSSRISWLSFFSSVFVAALVFLRNKKLLLALGGITTAAFTAAYVSGIAAIKSRITDIFVNWRTEERITVWTDTLRMLGDNSLNDWLLGHGIGSFRYYFPDYNTFKVNGVLESWSFPHNFLFQIIFENGTIGLLTILAGIALLMIGLWRAYHLLADKNNRYLLVTIFVIFWINFIHGALTLSFYHKYFIYPLSMTIGISLILLEKTGQNKPLKSLDWFQGFANFLRDKIPVLNRWLPERKVDT
ncbi:MAG: O-antigen ligase family protein [Desulfobacterales bacterium]|jgi:O-antigen ligase